MNNSITSGPTGISGGPGLVGIKGIVPGYYNNAIGLTGPIGNNGHVGIPGVPGIPDKIWKRIIRIEKMFKKWDLEL